MLEVAKEYADSMSSPNCLISQTFNTEIAIAEKQDHREFPGLL